MRSLDTLPQELQSLDYRPSHGETYVAYHRGLEDKTLDLPPNYQPADDSAIDYMRTVLPGVELEPFSNKGRTGVVLTDGHYAYKVFRQRTHGYDWVENEVAALEVLGSEDIAPRPVALIDAAPEHRIRRANDYGQPRPPLFGGAVDIPRYETAGHLPVIVTELQDVSSIDNLPAEKLATEFDRFALAALKHNVLFEDCQFLYDRRHDRAIVIDVGEVYHPDGNLPDEAKDLVNAQVVQGAFVRFGSSRKAWPTLEELAPFSHPDRLTGVHSLLYNYCDVSL